MRIKQIICVMVMGTLFLFSGNGVEALVKVDDVFGNDAVEYDANIDGSFDIRDLVHIKKYCAGLPITVNQRIVNQGSSDTELLINMRKELMQ